MSNPVRMFVASLCSHIQASWYSESKTRNTITGLRCKKGFRALDRELDVETPVRLDAARLKYTKYTSISEEWHIFSCAANAFKAINWAFNCTSQGS